MSGCWCDPSAVLTWRHRVTGLTDGLGPDFVHLEPRTRTSPVLSVKYRQFIRTRLLLVGLMVAMGKPRSGWNIPEHPLGKSSHRATRCSELSVLDRGRKGQSPWAEGRSPQQRHSQPRLPLAPAPRQLLPGPSGTLQGWGHPGKAGWCCVALLLSGTNQVILPRSGSDQRADVEPLCPVPHRRRENQHPAEPPGSSGFTPQQFRLGSDPAASGTQCCRRAGRHPSVTPIPTGSIMGVCGRHWNDVTSG